METRQLMATYRILQIMLGDEAAVDVTTKTDIGGLLNKLPERAKLLAEIAVEAAAKQYATDLPRMVA